MDAAVREGVEVRGLEEGMPHEPERVVTQVVNEDEDDVARLRARRALKRRRGPARGERRCAAAPNTSSAATHSIRDMR